MGGGSFEGMNSMAVFFSHFTSNIIRRSSRSRGTDVHFGYGFDNAKSCSHTDDAAATNLSNDMAARVVLRKMMRNGRQRELTTQHLMTV